MERAGIAFEHGNVVGKLRLMCCGIGIAAGGAILFVHPSNNTESALGFQMQLLHELHHLHGRHNAGAVINGACSQVPRIKMAGHKNNLLRMLRSFEVGNHIVTDYVGTSFGKSASDGYELYPVLRDEQ